MCSINWINFEGIFVFYSVTLYQYSKGYERAAQVLSQENYIWERDVNKFANLLIWPNGDKRAGSDFFISENAFHRFAVAQTTTNANSLGAIPAASTYEHSK